MGDQTVAHPVVRAMADLFVQAGGHFGGEGQGGHGRAAEAGAARLERGVAHALGCAARPRRPGEGGGRPSAHHHTPAARFRAGAETCQG